MNDQLISALEVALPKWVARVAPGVDPAPIVAETLVAIRALLLLDVDEQRTTPLAVIRDVAVSLLGDALRTAGVTPPGRTTLDPFLVERFPSDVYGLTPSGWAEIDHDLVGPGIAWGAAKAYVHRRRHEPPAPSD